MSFREIFVSRHLAENRRLKRCASSSAKYAAANDRQRRVKAEAKKADFKPKLEAHRFSRERDSARWRAFVYRAKRRWAEFPLKTRKSQNDRFYPFNPLRISIYLRQ